MIEIRQLLALTSTDLKRIASGYTSTMKYIVETVESNDKVSFNLELANLDTPYVKEFDLSDIERYNAVIKDNCSFGVYDDGLLVGLALAEIVSWNLTLWMHEFHLAREYRCRGLGKRLMGEVIQRADHEKLRAVVCETQNTNTAAIGFYRNLGFKIEGIDISYYSNNDFPDGEIAIFMKRRLE